MTIDKLTWIAIKDRRVLFARSKGKDAFYTPGGKREAGETDEQALLREVKEELTVELLPDTVRYLNTFSAQAHGKSEGVLVSIRCYTGEYVGELQPAAEIDELAWFSSEDGARTSDTGRLAIAWLKERDLID